MLNMLRRLALLLFLTLTTTFVCGQTSSPAGDALNRGVDAFKAGNYDEATNAFQAAVNADPGSATARLDLATAYAYQVVPGLDTPDNLALAQKAIDLFMQIPETDSGYNTALKQIASLYRNTKRFDEARATELRIVQLNPADAESHYTIGVIDWTEAYKFAVVTLGYQGLADDGKGNIGMSAATCATIRSHNMPLIDDTVLHLNKAVELDPDYADAMQYLNLTYRRRADFDCHDRVARQQDIAAAEDWTRKALLARKRAEAAKEKAEAAKLPLQ
jgi:tetratricopeptide (TPR) repeat protein